MSAQQLITEHIDLWTSVVKAKNTQGRGSSKKRELYGIKKLRELILELAVRGKLVSQDPNDEPASNLLGRIASEKAQLVKDKKIRKQKPLPPIGDEEQPFELPKGWEFVRNIEIFSLQKGKMPKNLFEAQLGKGYPYLDIEALDRGNILRHTDNENCPKSTCADILVVCDGSRSGLVLKGKDGVIGSTLARIDAPISLKSYIELFFKQAYVRLNSSMKGAAIPHLDTKALRNGVMAIPPSHEQIRIIAKVDELMALCDQMEQQADSSLDAHNLLVDTLLSTLTDARDASELSDNWTRLADHFDTLITSDYAVEQLKQTILQLAVQGKLVPQDPSDEPASELLKRVAAEKEQLIKDREIKKQKPLPAITDEEKPFELPEGWEFAHMQDLCSLITDGTHQTPKYSDTGRPFISAQCVKPFRFLPENCRYVSEEHYQGYIKNRKPEFRDILLARVGAGIGEAATIDSELEFAIYVSTGLLKPHREFLLPEYLTLWLNSPVGRDYSATNTLGKGVSQGNLNLSLIRTFLVSVPPFKEQKSIVTKTNELMTVCDQLKAQLNDAQTTQLHLSDAVVENALEV